MDRKKYIPLIAFAALLTVAIPFESGFTIEGLGDWNGVIPNTSYLEIMTLILISIITFLYGKIATKRTRINLSLFALHFLFTIPIVLWARFYFPLRQLTENANNILEMIGLMDRALYTVIALFFVGQGFFAVLLFKFLNRKKAGS
jgi:hypothetical protein